MPVKSLKQEISIIHVHNLQFLNQFKKEFKYDSTLCIAQLQGYHTYSKHTLTHVLSLPASYSYIVPIQKIHVGSSSGFRIKIPEERSLRTVRYYYSILLHSIEYLSCSEELVSASSLHTKNYHT